MTKDWVHGVGHSPVCQILLQIVVRTVITSSPPAWTSSAGMLSTPADSPFFNNCTAASASLRRIGWSSSVSGDSSVPMDLHWPYSCTVQSSILSIGSVSVVLHFSERSWIVVAFSCFTVVKSHELVCPLTVVLPQIFFNITTLFSYPFFFSLLPVSYTHLRAHET